MSKQSYILYIEDDIDELLSLAELIEAEGFFVFQATNDKEAVEILQKNQIDLILIDINLSSHNENYHGGLKLVNDLVYANVPKIVIMIDKDKRIHNFLIANTSIIDFSYKQDPERLKKLLTTLKKCLPSAS